MSGPQIFPSSTGIDSIDSHYEYVMARVLKVNPDRLFKGIVDAKDWPMPQATENAFYLSVDRSNPAKSVNSWHSPLYSFQAQWVWFTIGTDLQQGQQASNRGDRFRTLFQMQQELLYGLWAGFCEKKKWGITGSDDQGAPITSGTSYVPTEMLWWGKPIFTEKKDRNSGVLFGYGSVSLSAFAPAISE